ncbi:MAG: lysophospholipid acyltransferase family protein [Lentisphaeria bacterium]|jgi:hypothetical protein
MAGKKKTLPYWLVALGATLFRLLRHTWRVTVEDRAGLLAATAPWPAVTILWHNRIPILADLFPRRLRQGTAALASASRDGEAAAHLLRAFDYQVVRGSSSRGGHAALNALHAKLDAGTGVAITVDGPRGPRYTLHAGAVHLAVQTGRPLIPLALNAPHRWELKGWDRTQIPKPFSRVTLVIGEPLHLQPMPTDAERQAQLETVRQALLAITDDRRATTT